MKQPKVNLAFSLLLYFVAVSVNATPSKVPTTKTSKKIVSTTKNTLSNTTPTSVLTYVYDNFGRLSKVKDGSKTILEYKYDEAGNRSQVIHTQ